MPASDDPSDLPERRTLPGGGSWAEFDAALEEVDRSGVGRLHAALMAASIGPYQIDREKAGRIASAVPGYSKCLARQYRFRDQAVRAAISGGRFRQFVEYRPPLPMSPEPVTVYDLIQDCCAEPTRTVLVPRERILETHLILRYPNATDMAIHRATIEDPVTPLASAEDGDRLRAESEPIFATMISDLHHRDGDLTPLIRLFRDALRPGSEIAFTHLAPATEPRHAKALADLAEQYWDTTEPILIPRERETIERWFQDGDWDLAVSLSTAPDGTLPVWCIIASRT
ncbi:SAM-dependent methyltransferase [Amycolatopsis japonica]|uniref:SAM-dependent methyltransferase n=1 Tax=Amycolatopsis japonica TaxID=208439 RepID=UPI00366F1F15